VAIVIDHRKCRNAARVGLVSLLISESDSRVQIYIGHTTASRGKEIAKKMQTARGVPFPFNTHRKEPATTLEIKAQFNFGDWVKENPMKGRLMESAMRSIARESGRVRRDRGQLMPIVSSRQESKATALAYSHHLRDR
jgi:hypothetical protein